MLLSVSLLVSALLAPVAEAGRFRQSAPVLVYSRIDPLVNPGALAGHVHEVRGASRFRDVLDTPENMQGSYCTTLMADADKSNYWAPALYYINPNQTYSIIPGGPLIYYTMLPGRETFPFPPGLRMLTGLPNERDTGSHKMQGIGWNVDPHTQFQPAKGYNDRFMPNGSMLTRTPNQVSSHSFFPSCGWANQSLDSWDHFSHMSHPVNDKGTEWYIYGKCPESHPIQYPQIHLETFYKLSDWQRENWRKDEANLILSNGDTTGATFHADFVNGWDQDLLAAAIKDSRCTNEDPDDCPVLFPGETKKTDDLRPTCRYEGDLVDEDVGLWTPIDKLPGCNPRWNWDDGPTKPTCNDNPVPDPGYTPPNLQLTISGATVPYVMPDAEGDLDKDPQILGGYNTTHDGPMFVKWARNVADDGNRANIAYVRSGTQEQARANKVQNADNAHPTVEALKGVPGFTDMLPSTTFDMGRIKPEATVALRKFWNKQCVNEDRKGWGDFCGGASEPAPGEAAVYAKMFVDPAGVSAIPMANFTGFPSASVIGAPAPSRTVVSTASGSANSSASAQPMPTGAPEVNHLIASNTSDTTGLGGAAGLNSSIPSANVTTVDGPANVTASVLPSNVTASVLPSNVTASVLPSNGTVPTVNSTSLAIPEETATPELPSGSGNATVPESTGATPSQGGGKKTCARKRRRRSSRF